MRKMILLFTLFAFACTPMVALSATTAYGGSIAVQGKNVGSGESFTVDIILTGNDANITSMVVPIAFNNTHLTCTGVDFSGTIAAGTIDKSYSISGDNVTIRYIASHESTFSTITESSGIIAKLLLKAGNPAEGTIVAFDGANDDLSFEANGQIFSHWNRPEFADETGGNALLPSFMPGLVTISKVTDIEDIENDILPQSFELSQNYPNPFNPATTISFALPIKSNVRLEIFNLLGQKVANLIQGEMEAGYHEINWNAEKAPSGVYFYRLISDDKSLTRKMMLLK